MHSRASLGQKGGLREDSAKHLDQVGGGKASSGLIGHTDMRSPEGTAHRL